MKTEAINYGREKAQELLRTTRTTAGECESCETYGARFDCGGANYCIGCMTATIAEDEAKGGHLREGLWMNATPRRSSRLYRFTVGEFFRTLGESPAVEDEDEVSPAWDACYTCGKVAPLDIHGECIACELKAGK
jgi:hypothetical protein